MFPYENSETRLQTELMELKKKRQQCLDLISQRQDEYSLNYDTKGYACFDPSTIYVFDEMDKNIQAYQKQEKNQQQILKEIQERDEKARQYIAHLQKNELQLDEKPNKDIQDKINKLSKVYNNYILENIRYRGELSDLQKRSNASLK
ncbi:hypothetical protein M9Y10_040879 [Tritrichomonas musculus]|uniref:Uncharacterized protein n=1 Tax=Tritrichomonas musculus TaxID=1915356 RepID=A0ABR2K2U4_9EUKA